MDQAFIGRLESSFNLLAPRAPELADRFYALLFSRHAEVRPLFPESLSEQKKKLVASLALVVQNLRTPEKLVEPLQKMGARHVAYGTKPEHYPVVRDALVEVMADVAGEAWNRQLQEDWTDALDFVASVMLEGAENAAEAARC